MEEKLTASYFSPIGNLGITTVSQCLLKILFLTSKKTINPQSALDRNVIQQLKNYFKDPNFIFHLPIKLNGTTFQKRVYHALQKISSGKTKTYGDLAKQLKTSPRAIGNACRHNPIPIVIPCHRVVAENYLGGFAGNTSGKFLKIKKTLLKHETVF